MLTSVEGIYRNGQIELGEPPALVPNGTPVIVTFMGAGDIDLDMKGISESQAAELRAALGTFADWDKPEMDIYNDYDAAKSKM